MATDNDRFEPLDIDDLDQKAAEITTSNDVLVGLEDEAAGPATEDEAQVRALFQSMQAEEDRPARRTWRLALPVVRALRGGKPG